MSVKVRAVGGALVLVACTHRDPSVRARVEAAEAVERDQARETQSLAQQSSRLLEEYAEVVAHLEAAQKALEEGSAKGAAAARVLQDVEENYRLAERDYRWVTYAIVAAAAWDAGGAICDGVESTRSYRQRLGLTRDVCVDHSFAHALGGINHPLNYMPLDCGENSAYGASFWGKFADYPLYILRGLAVSALARLRCSSNSAAWSR